MQARRSAFASGLLLLVACGGSAESSKGGAGAPSTGVPSKGCEYDGKAYEDGASFAATDGCNSCRCDAGDVSCTEIGCGPPLDCSAASATYGRLMDQAKACDPQQPNQCTRRVFEGLGCGCDTFVNPANYDEAGIRSAMERFDSASCNQNANCGECNRAVTARCSAAGVCVTDSDPTDGVACRVDGVTYQNGSVGVPDPYSCNECECQDGRLICTEINCPKPCPAGTSPATSCAACDPTDACLELETGCFPSCSNACGDSCVDGACVVVCG